METLRPAGQAWRREQSRSRGPRLMHFQELQKTHETETILHTQWQTRHWKEGGPYSESLETRSLRSASERNPSLGNLRLRTEGLDIPEFQSSSRKKGGRVPRGSETAFSSKQSFQSLRKSAASLHHQQYSLAGLLEFASSRHLPWRPVRT